MRCQLGSGQPALRLTTDYYYYWFSENLPRLSQSPVSAVESLSDGARRRVPGRIEALLSGHAARRLVLACFIGLAVVSTAQRGMFTRSHATFPIFRQSFVHLVDGRNLYAAYPAEQGTEDRDLFKYNPSVAMTFAPLTLMPFLAGLLVWTLVNSLGVYAAMRGLFPERDATTATIIVFPALIAAVQSTSSNGLVAALMIGAFVALEAGSRWKTAGAIATGMLMKLFPAALLPMLLIRRDRSRWIAAFVIVLAALLAAPLLVTPWHTLVTQYKSWGSLLLADEGDLTFARSIMVVIRDWTGQPLANWVFQAAATVLLLAPLALRRSAWSDPAFRRDFFASLLVYVVIFNHQSENASYVIAAVGLAIWFLSAKATPVRVVLLLACMAGWEALPYFVVWGWMQFDLLDGGRLFGRVPARAAEDVMPDYDAAAA